MDVARFLVIAGALAGLICISAPEAAAQQPIIGCVKPGTGLLRIPPPDEGCKTDETPLTFDDLPLLVALRTQVLQLIEAVKMLDERLASVEACTDSIPQCNPNSSPLLRRLKHAVDHIPKATDTEIADGAVKFRVPEEKLDGAEIPGPPIDQRRPRASERMRSVRIDLD